LIVIGQFLTLTASSTTATAHCTIDHALVMLQHCRLQSSSDIAKM